MTVIDDLSYRATLMCRNVAVGDVRGRSVEAVGNAALLPLFFQKGGDFGEWLAGRAIDAHRTNSRLLKKALRLREKDDISTALHSNAVTITDRYWVKPAGSPLKWDDVRFKENEFASLALTGDLSAFSKKPSRTPELTNTGSFEKCWKNEGGVWWLYKQGNELQRFSELFIYHLCMALNFPVAVYENEGEFVKTKDFTEGKYNLEPASSLVGDNEDYDDNYKAFSAYGQKIADDYVQIIIMDTIVRNADRHTNNYGLLRDADTGEVICMAPNFDNNIALISNGYDKEPRSTDLFGQLLREFEEQTHAVSACFKRHPLAQISAALIKSCCKKTGIKADEQYIEQFVTAGYNQVLDAVK